MVRASELKSEGPGFDPVVGHRVREQFLCPSESTLVHTCLCLTPPPPPYPSTLVCTTRTHINFVRTLKIPYPAVVKEQASQQVVWKHENTAYRGDNPNAG